MMIAFAFLRLLCHGVEHLLGSFDVDTGNIFGVPSATGPLMSVTVAPRCAAAFAIAKPIFPEDLLPIKRTGSIGSLRRPGSDKNFFSL